MWQLMLHRTVDDEIRCVNPESVNKSPKCERSVKDPAVYFVMLILVVLVWNSKPMFEIPKREHSKHI